MFTRSHDANEDERRRQPRITRITPNDARAAKTTEEAAATRSVAVAPASGLMSGHRHQCHAAWRRVRVAALRAARGLRRSGSRTDLQAHRFVIPISSALATAGRTAGHTNTRSGRDRRRRDV